MSSVQADQLLRVHVPAGEDLLVAERAAAWIGERPVAGVLLGLTESRLLVMPSAGEDQPLVYELASLEEVTLGGETEIELSLRDPGGKPWRWVVRMADADRARRLCRDLRVLSGLGA